MIGVEDYKYAITHGVVSRLPPIDVAVRNAGRRLEPRAWAIIEEVDLMGWTLVQSAHAHRLTVRQVRLVRSAALNHLKRLLSPYVEVRFGLKHVTAKCCVICNHPRRIDIEKLIDERTMDEPWRDVIARLRAIVGIAVRSPQTLIQHNRRHRTKNEEELWHNPDD